jgi:SAM-dependent MidA family methyltransferase
LPQELVEQVHLGQQFEWVAGIEAWYAELDAAYKSCTVIVIDYGDVEAELLGPHRMQGTFVCYRKHQVSDDPFAYPGEQDMTAHVNFSQVRRVAEQLGWRVEPLRTQKQFLLDAGILQKLQAHGALDPFDPIVKRNRAIRQLLLTDQMSELFKVCIAHK